MRKFILAASFCMLAYTMCQTVTLGQPTSSYPTVTKATCTGTTAVNIKCPVDMPAGCFESLGCEADKEGHVGCFHAFAYNQDNFGCSAAKANPNGVPPSYTSLCLDSTNDITMCTLRKTCLAELIYRQVDDMPQPYTVCREGQITANYRHKKYTINDPECTSVVANP